MPYAKGVYHDRGFLPPPPRPVGVSSRLVVINTLEPEQPAVFELDATTGGYAGMPDTMNRVIHLIAFNVPPIGPFSSDSERELHRRRIIRALDPLTKSRPPAIDQLVVAVTASPDKPGYNNVDVSFRAKRKDDSSSKQL